PPHERTALCHSLYFSVPSLAQSDSPLEFLRSSESIFCVPTLLKHLIGAGASLLDLKGILGITPRRWY
ncbi:unnamed protein product, partial [Vitis vinifera]